MSERRFSQVLAWAAAIPATLLFVPLLVPMLTGRIFAHTDLAVFHLPLRRFYAAQLARGEQLLWSPHLFNGFYVHGEGQLGAFHPLHLLLYRFLPLQLAFNLEIFLSYPFAFGGMWFFLRHVGLSRASVIVGATTFTFSGFFLFRLGHPNAVAISAHIPWLLLAVDHALSAVPRRRAAGGAAVALLVGSQVLLGYPQYVWISALACAVFALLRSGDAATRRRLWLPAVAAMAGLAIGGVQLLPTLDLLGHSQRAEVSRSFALTFSLHPLNLIQLWSPYALPFRVHAAAGELYLHEFALYGGALSTLALLWVGIRRHQVPFRWLAAVGSVLAAVGLVLALGSYALVYRWLAALPLIGAFRAPARHILLVHLGFALLVPILFDDLLTLVSKGRRKRVEMLRWLRVPLMLSIATAVIAVTWWYATGSAARFPMYPVVVAIGTLFIGTATTLVRDAARGIQAALLVLPIFLALDLGVWGYSYAWGSPPLTLEQVVSKAAGPPTASPMSVHDQTGDPEVNYWLLKDVRVLHGYVGLYPKRSLPLDAEATWQVGGVQWVRGANGWREVQASAPRVRIVPEVRISDNPAADIRDIDIHETALVETQIQGPLAREATTLVLVDEPGRLELSIDTQQRALLAITESYHRGWIAERSGGASLETLPLYGELLGVVLEPGKYQLALRFQPDSIRRGWYVTYAGLSVMLLLSLLVGRNRPRA